MATHIVHRAVALSVAKSRAVWIVKAENGKTKVVLACAKGQLIARVMGKTIVRY